LARGVTTVAADRIAVITTLARLDQEIAAFAGARAHTTCGGTAPPASLTLAACGTAIATHLSAIVALLANFHGAVAACR